MFKSPTSRHFNLERCVKKNHSSANLKNNHCSLAKDSDSIFEGEESFKADNCIETRDILASETRLSVWLNFSLQGVFIGPVRLFNL